MMQTTEDSCPIICNGQISVICLSSSTYVTGLDSCQSDVAKAGVHKNVFAVLNVGLASGFTGLNRFYYISLTRKFRVKLSWNPRRTRKFRARGKTEALLSGSQTLPIFRGRSGKYEKIPIHTNYIYFNFTNSLSMCRSPTFNTTKTI